MVLLSPDSRTVQVIVWSEPMGGAIAAENLMSDLQMSFKVE